MASVPDAGLRDTFLAEAPGLLKQIEGCSLALTKDAGALEKLFRALHTFKGACGFLGLAALARLAQTAESALHKIRSSGQMPTEAMEEALLRAKDLMARGVLALERGENPEISIDTAEESLRAATGGAVRVRKTRATAPAVDRTAGFPDAIPVSHARLEQIFETMSQTVVGRMHVEADLGAMESSLAQPAPADEWKTAATEHIEELRRSLDEHARTLAVLQEQIGALRLTPLAAVFDRFPRVARETARRCGKEIEFSMSGGRVEIDRALSDAIVDPLIHLIRNAIDHGIESREDRARFGKRASGHVAVSARYLGDRVAIEVSDDGRGMDPDLIGEAAVAQGLIPRDKLERMDRDARLRLAFRAGFSTAERVTDLSGRGVGLDAVRDAIEKINGSVEVESEIRRGTRVRLLLPMTLALVDLLIVRTGGKAAAIPMYAIREMLPDRTEESSGPDAFPSRGELLPRAALAEILKLGPTRGRGRLLAVESLDAAAVLEVDELLDQVRTAIKPLDPLLAGAPFVTATALLDDGRLIPVLDHLRLIREACGSAKS